MHFSPYLYEPAVYCYRNPDDPRCFCEGNCGPARQPKYKYDPTCGKGYDVGGYECYGEHCEELGFKRAPNPALSEINSEGPPAEAEPAAGSDPAAPRAVLRDGGDHAAAAAAVGSASADGLKMPAAAGVLAAAEEHATAGEDARAAGSKKDSTDLFVEYSLAH